MHEDTISRYKRLLNACKDLMPKLCDSTVGKLDKQAAWEDSDNAEFGSLVTVGYLFRSPEAQQIMAILKSEGL